VHSEWLISEFQDSSILREFCVDCPKKRIRYMVAYLLETGIKRLKNPDKFIILQNFVGSLVYLGTQR
jgi:hypothetical protein